MCYVIEDVSTVFSVSVLFRAILASLAVTYLHACFMDMDEDQVQLKAAGQYILDNFIYNLYASKAEIGDRHLP